MSLYVEFHPLFLSAHIEVFYQKLTSVKTATVFLVTIFCSRLWYFLMSVHYSVDVEYAPKSKTILYLLNTLYSVQ